MDEVTVSRARASWEELAGGRFPERGGVRVVETTRSRLCPPGWAGIVMLTGAVLATAPTATQATLLREALQDAALREAALRETTSGGAAPPPPNGGLREAARLDTGSLPVRDTLGPAALAYLAPGDFQSYGDERPQDAEHPAPGVEWAGPAQLADLLAAVDPAEANESGLHGLPRAAVVRVGGRIVAAAGYDRWPAGTAHLCVLTATGHRGEGHATRVAAVATADALAAGLLPQWRARVRPSRRVADKLGYQVLGQQRSLLLAD